MRLRLLSRRFWAQQIANRLEKVKEGDVDVFLQLFKEYFHRFRNQYIVIFILIFIASGTTALTAWLVKDVVNGIFVEQQSQLLVPIVAVILSVFLIKGASTYFQTILSNRISNAMVADVQRRLFDHILKQRVTFFSKYGSDVLLMRFNQGAQAFHSILTTVLVKGSRDAATVISLFFVMLLQDPLLTVISFLTAPVIFHVIAIVLRKMKDLGQEELAGYAELNKHVRETVQGVTVVKAFNLEPTLRSKTDDVISGLEWRKNKIAELRAIPIPLLDTMGGIAVAVAILYAGFRTIMGGYDPGTFMSFVTALLLAADPARRLSQMRVTLRTSFIAVSAMFSLLNHDQSETSGSQKLNVAKGGAQNADDILSEDPIIAFRDVHFSYDGGQPVLNGLDLEIAPGEMVALVGPSGAGKSTVFKMLLQLHEPSSGHISVNGIALPQIDLISLRDTISFVGQSNFIFSGSIRDNLTLGNSAVSQEVIEAACETVDLHDFIRNLPNGYETDVGELGSMISGGQAQRLNMARAIIKDAPILLLDEVTSALDAENESLIKSYIQEQARKKTVLVIAHRLSTVVEADRIAIMDRGRIIDAGRHQQLLSANTYYEKIINLQFAQ